MKNRLISPRTIALRIEGEKIPAEKLRRAIGDFFNFLDEASANVTGRRKPIEWLVTVKKGSAIFAADPAIKGKVKPNTVNDVFKAVENGIDVLERGKGRPKILSDKALEYYQHLAISPSVRGEEGIIGISVIIDEREPLKLTKHAVEHIDEILGTHSKALGSVEGQLLTISERGSLKVVIYEALTDRAIDCHIDDFMLEDAMNAFGKRVYVYGLISYNKQGLPNRIIVEDMRIFPEDEAIPTAREICGLLGA